eukprot:29496-Pelagococcus_subviridis.AAC.4
MSPTSSVTTPRRKTPFDSSQTTHSHSFMSPTLDSTRYTCGDFTNAMMLAGFLSAPVNCNPRVLYPLGKSCTDGKPRTSYRVAAARYASTSIFATLTSLPAKCTPTSR